MQQKLTDPLLFVTSYRERKFFSKMEISSSFAVLSWLMLLIRTLLNINCNINPAKITCL